MSTQLGLLGTFRSSSRVAVNSALWAAAGDALGWITELSRGEAGVHRRTGEGFVSQPVNWHRGIGGRTGVTVEIPAGSYSDDTQLRLAVCRSIRGDGHFDAEPFAKIELPVWTSYALGAGRGTKAAASNLTKRSVNWFSNFFQAKDQRYVRGGGNGAAMRVQPHVWAARPSSDRYLLDCLRDSLITHGHGHGFGGALFHAQALRHAIAHGRIPQPDDLEIFILRLAEIPRIISEDAYLQDFWRSAWESETNTQLDRHVMGVVEQTRTDLERVVAVSQRGEGASYHRVLEELGCLDAKFRGSGIKTALAASMLSLIYEKQPIEEALVASANELQSDTDTIATMAGAILGAVSTASPEWPIQDASYIAAEAGRLSQIAAGESAQSFAYPDLSVWNPPVRQLDAIGTWRGSLAVVGLGAVEPIGEEYKSQNSVWQWMTLPFGQTILAKRRASELREIDDTQMPTANRVHKPAQTSMNQNQQPSLPLSPRDLKAGKQTYSNQPTQDSKQHSPLGIGLDELTERVIRSNFDERLIGRIFMAIVEEQGTIETALAFSAIVAKARLARRRRGR